MGGKASGLWRLKAFLRGTPISVPRTACWTTEASGELLGALHEELASGAQLDDVRMRILALSFPRRLERCVEYALEITAGATAVAVRSSGQEEDSARTSFAGQHLTVVTAATMSDLRRAILRCLASGYEESVQHYRAQRGLPRVGPPLALVIQELVLAESAGVLFTVDPRGAGGRAIVEGTWGLGDALVDGSIIPDAWTVARDDPPAVVDRHVAFKAERRVIR